jgi:hypothetical protein
VQKGWVDRKWDALPALPVEEGAPEPLLKDHTIEGDETEPFNTEELLSSLRPERLSLYHISAPGCSTNGFDDIGYKPAAITPHPAHTITSGTTRTEDKDSPKVSDDDSIRTREWDLQSCAMGDLGIDSRLGQQEHFTRSKRRRGPLEKERHTNIRDNNGPLNGSPDEDASSNGLSDEIASTPESVFCAELIDIMKNYHEQQRVIERAFEVDQVSEEQRRRKNWTHKTALDVKVRAAADMSGYEVGTRCSQVKHIRDILG